MRGNIEMITCPHNGSCSSTKYGIWPIKIIKKEKDKYYTFYQCEAGSCSYIDELNEDFNRKLEEAKGRF